MGALNNKGNNKKHKISKNYAKLKVREKNET